MVDVVVWDGSDLVWDGSDLVWGDAGPEPAPAWPADLLGTFAPQLLAYTPHYAQSTFMRAIIQAIGYEFDAVLAVIEELDTLAIFADCPEWALEWWEAAYGLAPDGWSTAERRTALAACLLDVSHWDNYKTYVAAFARIDPAGVDVSITDYDLTVTLPLTVTGADLVQATLAAQRATPVHIALTVDTA